jgi:beta-ureidopropionase / N-carbamoyl-L-amino-acid hydrolase
LHIEQGPVLEQAGTPLGVVTGIQGVSWYRVKVQGQMAHAGTTPMDTRDDAMATAVGLAQQLYAYALAERQSALRLTLGRWLVDPNSINTIPGSVEFTIDVRCPDAAVLERFDSFLNATLSQHPRSRALTHERIFSRQPTVFPVEMQQVVERAALRACSQSGNAAPIALTSGAFHDAMYLADHCPTGMIFVPSQAGISHNAAEETDPAHLALGARALAYAVTELACR